MQQFVIGLSQALCGLDDGDEEFVFLARRGEGEWLSDYVRDASKILWVKGQQGPRPLTRELQSLRGGLARHAPILRTAWRAMGRGQGRPVSIPVSDGTVERAGLDLIHFTFQAAFLTGVPSIYQPWDLQHVHLPEFFTDTERRWRDATYRAYSRQARLVVVASDWTRRDLVENLGIDAARITVVGVPAATTAYRAPTASEIADVRQAKSLPPRFVLYPAQTWAHKNHLRLLAALRQLADQSCPVHLVCTGVQNAYFPTVRDEVRRLDLGDLVHFVGFVDDVEMRALYALARALIFPSLYEGWGLPIMEAFEAGLAVGCSNATSLPELAGSAAILFDPLDVPGIATAIQRLWNDDALVSTLVERGRHIAGTYSWERTARIYRAHYRAALGKALSPEDLAFSGATH